MSSTEPRTTTYDTPATIPPPPVTDVRGPATDTFRVERKTVRETKPFLLTTEFWAMVAGVAALAVIYNVSDDPSLDLFRVCLLATVLGAAYIVSRGFAKSGSQKHWEHLPSDDRS